MRTHLKLTGAILALAGMSLFGCHQGLSPTGTQGSAMSGARFFAAGADSAPPSADELQSNLEKLANPRVRDWSTGAVHCSAADRLMVQLARANKARKVQEVTDVAPRFLGTFTPPDTSTQCNNRDGDKHNTQDNRDGLKHDAQNNADGTKHCYRVQAVQEQSLPSSVSGAPAVDYWTGKTYWLGEDGTIYTYDRNALTPPAAAYQVSEPGLLGTPTTNVYPKTTLTLDFSGRYFYVCSQDGDFEVVDTSNGLTIARIPMGGADLTNVGFTASPFVDYWSSNGAYSTVYAVNNVGTLYRFTVNLSTGNIDQWQTYALPRTNTASVQEFFRTSPIVYKGQLFVGTWRKSSSGRNFDKGAALAYYTNVTAPTLSPTSLSPRFNTLLNYPVYATPSIDLNPNTMDTTFGFVPSGNTITMIKLFGAGDKIESLPLVVNDKSAGVTGHPTVYDATLDDYTGIQNQCVIGLNHDVYVMNNNALFKVSYASPSTDGTPSEFTDASWFERQTSWAEYTTTWYGLSALGQSMNTTAGGKYLHNFTQLCFDWSSYGAADGGSFYTMDNNGTEATTSAVFLNRFSMGPDMNTAPSLNASYDLRRTGTPLEAAATQLGGLAIASDTNTSPMRFVFNTRSNTANATTAAGLWVYP